MFAERMGARTVEVASGHLAMVSHPDAVSEFIQTAATRSGRGLTRPSGSGPRPRSRRCETPVVALADVVARHHRAPRGGGGDHIRYSVLREHLELLRGVDPALPRIHELVRRAPWSPATRRPWPPMPILPFDRRARRHVHRRDTRSARGRDLALAVQDLIREPSRAGRVVDLRRDVGGGVYRLGEIVVPGDQLRGSALEWAQRLAKGPTGAHAATKRLLRHALANGTRSADGYMSEVVPPLFVGHDLSAGVDYLLTHGVQKFRENHDEIVFIGE